MCGEDGIVLIMEQRVEHAFRAVKACLNLGIRNVVDLICVVDSCIVPTNMTAFLTFMCLIMSHVLMFGAGLDIV